MNGDINRNTPLFIKILGFVILTCVSFFIKSYFFDTRAKNEKEAIQSKLDSLNKMLPMLIDNSVRADTVFMLEDGGFKYCYTLIDVDNKTPQIYIDALKYRLKTKNQENFNTNDGMKPFRDIEAKINNYYKDKNGYYLFDFTIRSTKK